MMGIEYPSAFYHIISRGNGSGAVTHEEPDFQRMTTYLKSIKEWHGAQIHCFCLMPNHSHLLIETTRDNLASILVCLNMMDAEYFTARAERDGHFFRSRCRVILIHQDSSLLELSRYIHLNPVRGHLVDDPCQYPWSSYQDYLGVKKTWDWLSTHIILSQLGSDDREAQRRYRNYVWAAIREITEDSLENSATSKGGSDRE